MIFALGAASAAMNAIQALTSPATSSKQASGSGENPFALPGDSQSSTGASATTGFTGGGSQISPATMDALLEAQSQATSSSSTTTSSSGSTSPSDALQDLFSQIDGNGDGSITKSEFENALGAGGTNIAAADHVFNELDSNGDGSVSSGELSAALKGAGGSGGHHGHHHVAGAGQSSDADGTDPNSDPLLQALAASSSTSSSNGASSTPTLIPIDKSSLPTISLGQSGLATSSYNATAQMLMQEMQSANFANPAMMFSA